MSVGHLAAAVLEDREILYFFKMEGCPACHIAEPEVNKYSTAHPEITVLVLRADGPFPSTLGVNIKATPTYVFRRGNDMAVTTGMLKVKELERWIKKLLRGE